MVGHLSPDFKLTTDIHRKKQPPDRWWLLLLKRCPVFKPYLKKVSFLLLYLETLIPPPGRLPVLPLSCGQSVVTLSGCDFTETVFTMTFYFTVFFTVQGGM
jgi:hypothetical protein